MYIVLYKHTSKNRFHPEEGRNLLRRTLQPLRYTSSRVYLRLVSNETDCPIYGEKTRLGALARQLMAGQGGCVLAGRLERTGALVSAAAPGHARQVYSGAGGGGALELEISSVCAALRA